MARRSQTGHLPVSGHEIVLVSAVEVWIGCSSMKLAFFMDVEVWTWCSSMKLAFFMDIEVWIGSLAIKLAFIMADEVRQGGRTVLQARRPTHNYPRGDPVRDNPDRGDPGRGGNAHFADNPCLFTGKMVYLRPHNFRAG